MRDLVTPFGTFAYDPAALGAALNLAHEAATRDPAPDFAPGHPQVQIREGQWCRLNIVGGRWWPIPTDELRELLGIEEAA